MDQQLARIDDLREPAKPAPLAPLQSIAEATQSLAQLRQFVQAVMVKGEDYGTIPGTPKPTLYKAGAEKMLEIYGLGMGNPVVEKVEDWEGGFLMYTISLPIIDRRNGQQIGLGLGSCNSREKRYAKQASYALGDLANTILKMAKKRALVDGALSVTRSSALFTQDIEDMDIEPRPIRATVGASRPAGTPPPDIEINMPPPIVQQPNTTPAPRTYVEGQFSAELDVRAAAPRNIQDAHATDSLDCADCEKPLKETAFRDGTVWTAEILANYGLRKHNRRLCMACYRKANNARRQAEEMQEPPADEAPSPVSGADLMRQFLQELNAANNVLELNDVGKRIQQHYKLLTADQISDLNDAATDRSTALAEAF